MAVSAVGTARVVVDDMKLRAGDTYHSDRFTLHINGVALATDRGTEIIFVASEPVRVVGVDVEYRLRKSLFGRFSVKVIGSRVLTESWVV